jgi:uncharacterized protein (UPF0261 family)
MLFGEKFIRRVLLKNQNAVLLVATMDTKGKEVLYLISCFEELGIPVLTLDAGIMGESPFSVMIHREKVALAGGMTLSEVRALGHEGKALEVMITGAIRCARDLYREGKIKGILGLGGSMGTTLGTGVMRAFPIGFPKVMISSMASRNTRAFVRTKDILMLHSVCDLSGINRVTKKILRNGAFALAGMVKDSLDFHPSTGPLIIVSTLGTIETCAVNVRRILESMGKEVVVFHTVGSGGEAMEEMICEEEVEAVVDLSLNELVNHLFGGDYDAGPNRGSTALRKGIPTVLVPGNIDFLATGPIEEARKRFPGRIYHIHNAAITAVRTERIELEAVAHALAQRCSTARGPFSILVPLGGFSVFDRQGGPFYDPEGPGFFGRALKKHLQPGVSLRLLPYHINDPEFTEIVIESLEQVLKIKFKQEERR